MTEQLLIAQIAGRRVAIRTVQVESVIDIGPVMPVPRAVAQVRGLVAIRSRVVTVIDTDIALGLVPSGAALGRAVITMLDGHHYAILVESLEDVETLDVQPLSTGLTLVGGWAACGTAIVEHDGEPMLVIDLAALIPAAALAA